MNLIYAHGSGNLALVGYVGGRIDELPAFTVPCVGGCVGVALAGVVAIVVAHTVAVRADGGLGIDVD